MEAWKATHLDIHPCQQIESRICLNVIGLGKTRQSLYHSSVTDSQKSLHRNNTQGTTNLNICLACYLTLFDPSCDFLMQSTLGAPSTQTYRYGPLK